MAYLNNSALEVLSMTYSKKSSWVLICPYHKWLFCHICVQKSWYSCIIQTHKGVTHLTHTFITAATERLKGWAPAAFVPAAPMDGSLWGLISVGRWPSTKWGEIDQCVTILHHSELICVWKATKPRELVALGWLTKSGQVQVLREEELQVHPTRSISSRHSERAVKKPWCGTKVENAKMFLGMGAQADTQAQRDFQLSKEDVCQGLSGKKRRMRKNPLLKLKPHKARLEIRHMLLVARLINHGRNLLILWWISQHWVI